jgi:hypothetical protein
MLAQPMRPSVSCGPRDYVSSADHADFVTMPANCFSKEKQTKCFERNGHLETFYHSKKVPKLTEGKIVTSFFGTFWGGFGPEKQLFGGVS